MEERASVRTIVLAAVTCLLVGVSALSCSPTDRDPSPSETADAQDNGTGANGNGDNGADQNNGDENDGSGNNGDGGDSAEPEPTAPSPTDDRPDGRDDELRAEYDALLRKAGKQGTVDVIVRLELTSTPGPRAAQRKAIADAQQRMFDELARYGFEPGRTYERWPMFSASVDQAALRHLFSSPDVSRVWESKTARVE